MAIEFFCYIFIINIGYLQVINYTLPSTYQNYVHRVGRTARAGHCGRSISLVGVREYTILKQIKKSSNTVVYERQLNKGNIKDFNSNFFCIFFHVSIAVNFIYFYL